MPADRDYTTELICMRQEQHVHEAEVREASGTESRNLCGSQRLLEDEPSRASLVSFQEEHWNQMAALKDELYAYVGSVRMELATSSIALEHRVAALTSSIALEHRVAALEASSHSGESHPSQQVNDVMVEEMREILDGNRAVHETLETEWMERMFCLQEEIRLQVRNMESEVKTLMANMEFQLNNATTPETSSVPSGNASPEVSPLGLSQIDDILLLRKLSERSCCEQSMDDLQRQLNNGMQNKHDCAMRHKNDGLAIGQTLAERLTLLEENIGIMAQSRRDQVACLQRNEAQDLIEKWHDENSISAEIFEKLEAQGLKSKVLDEQIMSIEKAVQQGKDSQRQANSTWKDQLDVERKARIAMGRKFEEALSNEKVERRQQADDIKKTVNDAITHFSGAISDLFSHAQELVSKTVAVSP